MYTNIFFPNSILNTKKKTSVFRVIHYNFSLEKWKHSRECCSEIMLIYTNSLMCFFLYTIKEEFIQSSFSNEVIVSCGVALDCIIWKDFLIFCPSPKKYTLKIFLNKNVA